jgi:hypothetical protein
MFCEEEPQVPDPEASSGQQTPAEKPKETSSEESKDISKEEAKGSPADSDDE